MTGPRKMGPARRMPMVRSPLPEVRMALPGPRLRMPPPPMFGPPGPMHENMMRPWMPPPPGSMPMRPGMMPPRAMFGPRGRPPIGFRPMGPRPPMGPVMRPRGIVPGRAPPYMRPRFPSHMHNGHKIKSANNKKNNKIEEMALKKAWMTDEIRNEIQKKNKLYAKASKNKDGKEWEEFKDLRNKVTRMIRDAKNEYNSKNPNKGEDNNEELEDEEINDENVGAGEESNSINDNIEEADYENYYYDYWNYNEEEASGEVEDGKPVEKEEIFFCDICAREFADNARLQKHIAEHEVCGVDGCMYTAHPKLIKIHHANQHATGLYRRMKSITDDEKYIAERKKRFPTLVNLEKKLAEQLEKEERGEVVNQKTTSKNRKENKMRQRRETRKKNQHKRNKVQETVTLGSLEITYKGLQMFGGIDTLSKNSSDVEEEDEEFEVIEKPNVKDKVENPAESFCISDDEEDLPVLVKTKQDEPIIINSLGLLAGYGSDSNEDEPPEEVPIKKLKMDPMKLPEEIKAEVSKEENAADHVSNVNKSLPEIAKKKTQDEWKQMKTPSNKTNNDRINDKTTRRQVKVRGSQLLEKLLSREIQHERNTIFQCLKYIADNHFFPQN